MISYKSKIKIKEILNQIVLFTSISNIGLSIVLNYLLDFDLIEQNIAIEQYDFKIMIFLSVVVIVSHIAIHLDKKFLCKLCMSYVVYLIVSYSLLFTQNLNNETFYIFDYKNNNFFEIGSFSLISILITISYLIRFIIKRNNYNNINNKSIFRINKSNLVLSLVVVLIVLHDSKLLEKLSLSLNLSTVQNINQVIISLAYKLPMIIFTLVLITYTFWNALIGIKYNKSTLSLAVVSSFLFALIFNFTIQYGIKVDSDYLGEYIFSGATLFQIILLVLFFLIFYFILNNYWLSTLMIIFFGTAITLANGIKFAMRSEPLLITDFSMINQLDLIFSFLDSKILILTVVLIVFVTVAYFFLKKRYLRGKIFKSLKIRFILTLSIFSIIWNIFNIFLNQEGGRIHDNIPVLSRLNNGKNIAFEGHARSAQYQSLIYVWVKQLTKPIMEKPDNYSQESIKRIVDKYKHRAMEINENRDRNIEDQTLIFILSESLADPLRIEGVTLTEDVMTNIKAIQKDTTSGLMKSDTYGGGTANIEIQTILGLPFYNLSNSIAIYNVEVIPKMSILPSISDQYLPRNREVIHLGGTQLYSRADVYNRLGFQTFIADDLNATQPFENIKYGGYPSDASTYKNILESIDIGESQFFSVITYQNHIPFTMDEPASISGIGEGFTEIENSRLTNYARLVYETDIVTQEFLDKLKELDKEITVVFYGDHLPGIYPQSAFDNNPESQYLTDYFIWSNKKNQKKEYSILNSSDMPAAVFSHTNSKVSPYYALLTDVLENASVNKQALTDSERQIANDLKNIQYDLTAGNSYLKKYDEFFAIVLK
ncbi:LTA synthase family protein [Streptococcus rifensis]